MVEVIGAPFDMCGPHHGSRSGPLAIRLAGLEPQLQSLLGEGEVRDLGDVVQLDARLPGARRACDEAGIAVYSALRAAVGASLGRGAVPLVLGGDHSVSIGSVSAAVNQFGDSLALLWIDAHADCNSPATTPSGNLHGMPIGALAGVVDKAPPQSPWAADLDLVWTEVVELAGPARLPLQNVAWLGLREVDEGEAARILGTPGCYCATMQTVDERGVGACVDGFWEWADRARVSHVWVSMDVDVLDPVFAPGTGTAVRGGLSYREGHLLAEMLREGFDHRSSPALAGLDVVEVNPLRDHANSTANIALEWILSFFGQSILHERLAVRK